MRYLIIAAGLALACSSGRGAGQSAEPRPVPAPADPTAVSTREPGRESPTSLEQILAGRISGVTVSSAPGGGIIVRMGGPTSFFSGQEPLYVVDGMAVEARGGALAWLNPQDVEYIRALKGADASIYGVRGANGVIVIKTKGSH